MYYNRGMKYFIDFEATQFSSEIISVGCVDENGREFYSLVQPNRLKAVTGFITDLTGITVDDISAAPSADAVFADFYHWLDHTEPAKFYCYGNCDRQFAQATLRYVSDFTAQSALGLIISSLTDVLPELMEHFGINQSISLYKVTEYYRGESIEKKHNSLEDAVYLKYVYECSKREKITACPFPDYQSKKTETKKAEPPRTFKLTITATLGNIRMVFHSYGKAADWLISELMSKNNQANEKTRGRVCNKIANAAKQNEPYCGYTWTVQNG